MKPTPSFALSEFTNPSGEIVFRVSGWLDGKRLRKNFPTRAEAKAELQALEIEALQDETGLRRAVTRLSEEQLHEAESVFCRLAGQPHSLTFCVDYTLNNYRAPGNEQPLADAVTAYVAAKEHERDHHALSACHVKNIAKELKKLLAHFRGCKLPELTAARLRAFCERGNPSLKTVNLRRGILSTFFKFAFQRDWIAANPVEKIPCYRLARRRSSADTLTVPKAAELMAFVEGYRHGELVPSYALCLFAGIRPCLRSGEITKLRAEHIQLDEGRIVIPPEVSKVHEKRVVTIQPNLAAWLRAYPLEKFPLIPSKHLQNTREPVSKRFALSRTGCATRSFRCSSRNSARSVRPRCRRATPRASSASITSTSNPRTRRSSSGTSSRCAKRGRPMP
jgi:integrase